MNNSAGKFIVIDGTDGSGKTTQFNLLKKKLEQEGYAVGVADFPQYNHKSAGLVEEYLSGKYGQADEVSPYQASIFYAVDRFDASFKIRQWLKEGKIVLANRYTSANLGHQGCKIDNSLERRIFFSWLFDLEYKIFQIPKPDLSIILHVEANIAQRLAKQRAREDWVGKTTDIHEDNLEHLKKAEQVYLELASIFPDFKLIRCTKNDTLLNREEIHFLVWLAVKKITEATESNRQPFSPMADIIGARQQIVNHRDKIFNSRPETSLPNSKVTDDQKISLPIIKGKWLVEKLSPEAKLPQKSRTGDAAYDLYANDYYSLNPYGQATVTTGIKMAIPEGYVGLIWDRSGLASSGITTFGGVIDPNYRGEIKVVVKNLSEDVFNIIPGQKIAQIIIQATADLNISEEKINDLTDRAANGFGSSGQF